jgi:hypothetical protein
MRCTDFLPRHLHHIPGTGSQQQKDRLVAYGIPTDRDALENPWMLLFAGALLASSTAAGTYSTYIHTVPECRDQPPIHPGFPLWEGVFGEFGGLPNMGAHESMPSWIEQHPPEETSWKSNIQALEGLAPTLPPLVVFVFHSPRISHELPPETRTSDSEETTCIVVIKTDAIYLSFPPLGLACGLPYEGGNPTPNTCRMQHGVGARPERLGNVTGW